MSKLRVFTAVLLMAAALCAGKAVADVCSGRFPNPITDVCWRCMFPLKLGGVPLIGGDMEDTPDSAPLICACPAPPPLFYRIGVGISFWEPARVAEATRTPFCSPTLGGVTLGGGGMGLIPRGDNQRTPEDENGFYHMHWFYFPLLTWMNLLTNTACASTETFDVAMLSELEPTWNNDSLSLILSPEASLFATIPLQAACAADCLAASTWMPLDPLFWCAGCQGSLYPWTGNISGNEDGRQSGLRAVQRMHSKLHRTMIAWDYGSAASMCGPIPMPIMPKSHYKTQMLYPIPNTQGCQPYGRSTAFWGAGKEYPVEGEDFAYLIWRKRVCCAL